MTKLEEARNNFHLATHRLHSAIYAEYPVGAVCNYRRSEVIGWKQVHVIAHGYAGRVQVMNRATGAAYWLHGESESLRRIRLTTV